MRLVWNHIMNINEVKHDKCDWSSDTSLCLHSSINVLSACHFTYSTKMQQEQSFRKSLIISYRYIMEYLPGLPQDTKPLRCCFGNRAKMRLQSHLGIKCHSQYNKAIRLLQHSCANRLCRWQGMHCAWPRYYHGLSLTRIRFHPPKVTPLINLDEVTAHWICFCNSNSWEMHNNIYQSGVIDITDQLFLQNGKKLGVEQEEQQRVQNTSMWHSWHDVSQFTLKYCLFPSLYCLILILAVISSDVN